MDQQRLTGKKVAFLVAPEGAEQIELTEPWKAVERAGGTPRLLSTKEGQVQAFNHLDRGDTFDVNEVVREDAASEFDALVLPGGVANPDYLRTQDAAVGFVKRMFESGKPVGVICHGPWTLIEADVVRGRTITSYPSLQTDLRNAGATWVDEEVSICNAAPSTLVSSRNPDDLKAFNQAIVEAFAAA